MSVLSLTTLFLLSVACAPGSTADDSGPGTSSGSGEGDDGGNGGDGGDGGGSEGGARINEFMASNRSTVTDEAGAYPDWIELHNPTSADMDLTGWTITDDLDTPDKHVLPEGLGIDAGGYILLWADADMDEGDRHLPFRLSISGEDLGLYTPSGAAVDALSYAAQTTDVSLSRVGDSEDWAPTPDATPGSANAD